MTTIDATAEHIDPAAAGPEFAELHAEAAADNPPPGAGGDMPPEAPPVDPRTVAILAKLLQVAASAVAPRWLAIISEQDTAARQAGVDTPGGLTMIAEAAVPVLDRYMPNFAMSPVANLLVVAGLVLSPCIGEPLRDPPPKPKADPKPAEPAPPA